MSATTGKTQKVHDFTTYEALCVYVWPKKEKRLVCFTSGFSSLLSTLQLSTVRKIHHKAAGSMFPPLPPTQQNPAYQPHSGHVQTLQGQKSNKPLHGCPSLFWPEFNPVWLITDKACSRQDCTAAWTWRSTVHTANISNYWKQQGIADSRNMMQQFNRKLKTNNTNSIQLQKKLCFFLGLLVGASVNSPSGFKWIL